MIVFQSDLAIIEERAACCQICTAVHCIEPLAVHPSLHGEGAPDRPLLAKAEKPGDASSPHRARFDLDSSPAAMHVVRGASPPGGNGYWVAPGARRHAGEMGQVHETCGNHVIVGLELPPAGLVQGRQGRNGQARYWYLTTRQARPRGVCDPGDLHGAA